MNNPIDYYNENGRTRLMEAAIIADLPTIKRLFSEGADPNKKDNTFNTTTALDMVLRLVKTNTDVNYDETIKLLREASKEDNIDRYSDVDEQFSIIGTNTSQNSTDVVIKDIDMPFWSMVWLMVKVAIACIPAFIILFIIGAIIVAISGVLREL